MGHNFSQSRRLAMVQPPVIPIIAEEVRRHPGTISLGQGVVSYPPPPESAEAIASFFQDPARHKYQAVDGLPELRRLLTEKLELENKIRAGEGSECAVVVTAGGNMAFMNAVLAVADPGDEIILLSPYYFNHEMAVTMAGCRAVIVPTTQNFHPDLQAIEAAITRNTRAVVTVSPNNPTGAVYSEASLRAVNQLCRERGLFHLSDEAYEYFTYDDAVHFSPGSIEGSAPHTISLFSLSKAYGFASWRIGYMVVPSGLLVAVKKIQDTILICPPVISQFAAIGALKAGRSYCAKQKEILERVRNATLKSLESIAGLHPRSEGAFYLFLRLPGRMDSMEMARRLITDYRVAVLPGSTFGVGNECALRVSYGALSSSDAQEAVGRLKTGIQALG